MEDITSIDKSYINNESQDFELISNYSTEDIIDKANTNEKLKILSTNLNLIILLNLPNFEAINDDNIETSSSDLT